MDEAGGLLSRECPIRFIITKQALQEGWDCSFAYVLTILTNPGSRSALTQLVGRILRQPYARKTRVPWLDECYLFDRTNEDELNGLENKVATYLDRQERLFFWYRNRTRKDYYVQGWKRGRIYADFIFTLRPDEADAGDEYRQVFVMETKGIHIKQYGDTDYKRSVFDICTEHASKKDWAEFVPAMRDKVMRFEIVDEDEWEQRLNAMLAV